MRCKCCNKLIRTHIELDIDNIIINFCDNECMLNYIKNNTVRKTKDDIYKMVVEFRQVKFIVSYRLNKGNIEIVSLNDQDGNVWEKNTIGNYLDSKRHIVFNDLDLMEEISKSM